MFFRTLNLVQISFVYKFVVSCVEEARVHINLVPYSSVKDV